MPPSKANHHRNLMRRRKSRSLLHVCRVCLQPLVYAPKLRLLIGLVAYTPSGTALYLNNAVARVLAIPSPSPTTHSNDAAGLTASAGGPRRLPLLDISRCLFSHTLTTTTHYHPRIGAMVYNDIRPPHSADGESLTIDPAALQGGPSGASPSSAA